MTDVKIPFSPDIFLQRTRFTEPKNVIGVSQLEILPYPCSSCCVYKAGEISEYSWQDTGYGISIRDATKIHRNGEQYRNCSSSSIKRMVYSVYSLEESQTNKKTKFIQSFSWLWISSRSESVESFERVNQLKHGISLRSFKINELAEWVNELKQWMSWIKGSVESTE